MADQTKMQELLAEIKANTQTNLQLLTSLDNLTKLEEASKNVVTSQTFIEIQTTTANVEGSKNGELGGYTQ